VICRKVWISPKFGFVGKSKLLDFPTRADTNRLIKLVLMNILKKYKLSFLEQNSKNTKSEITGKTKTSLLASEEQLFE